MKPETFYLVCMLFVGGFTVIILIALLPLLSQIKKTARQLETTAASLNSILNQELKALLTRGESALERFGEIQPLVKEKLNHISDGTTQLAFLGLSEQLIRGLIFWTLKEVWRKIRKKKKDS